MDCKDLGMLIVAILVVFFGIKDWRSNTKLNHIEKAVKGESKTV